MARHKVVVIGADAGGMAAISQLKKGRPDADVVAFERGNWSSYSACGIPFVVGGEVDGGVQRLVARSPQDHRANGIDLRMRHEVTSIDVAARTVDVHAIDEARRYTERFDQLLIGTGGSPVRPPLPGIDLPYVRSAQTLDDAAWLAEYVERNELKHIVVVGGGYIGIEMVEAFLHRDCRPTLLSRGPHPLNLLEPDMAALVATELLAQGVDYRPNCEVVGFEPGAVITTAGSVRADLVVLGIGTGPNSAVAKAAGLSVGVKEAIVVDERQQTSVEGIWAAGDCVESTHLITRQKVHMALGTYANKQARVAGINIGGGSAVTAPVLGTAITKFMSLEMAVTGINVKQAAAIGMDVGTTTIESSTKSGYYPGSAMMTIKILFERPTGRLVGAQIVGGSGAAKRIDTCVVAMTAGMTVSQIVDLDLAYAPPFSPTWDPVAVVAREALKCL